MKKIIFGTITSLLLSFLTLTFPSTCSAAIIGAIRWDNWYGNLDSTGHAVEISLGPKQWHFRVPFFGKIVSGTEVSWNYTQATMDQEIAFAKESGLSYWAFLLYYPRSANLSAALNYYLTSSHINDINFAGIASQPILNPNSLSSDKNVLFSFMARPSYQKVLGNRPLLYYYTPESLTSAWGNNQAVKDMFTQFRLDAQAKGLGNPYIVLMDYDISRAASLKNAFGADAISAYAMADPTISSTTSYQSLSNFAKNIWDLQKNTGSNVIPLVMTGWDRRPRIEHPVPWEPWQRPGVGIDTYYQKATPTELVAHLQQAVIWSTNNQSANPANAILIYAWNENDEGGWLTPTIYEGDARLQEFAKYIKGSYFTSPRYKGRDINNDDKIDISDYNQMKNDFGKTLWQIRNNADITADGKVDIFDYNELIVVYGK